MEIVVSRVVDVTEHLIDDASSGPGEYVRRVVTTKGARTLSPTLAAFFETWRKPSDKTMGFTSKALAYSNAVSRVPSFHKNMIRLIKGGHVRACEVQARPPADSVAHRDSPYGDRFYLLHAGACPSEIEPSAATFSGARRRRR